MNPKDFQQSIDDTQSGQTQVDDEAKKHEQILLSNRAIAETIGNATRAIAAVIKSNEPSVTVKNQPVFPSSIKTPDIEKVVSAIEELAKVTDDDQPLLDALAELKQSIDGLPSKIIIPENEKVESVEISNQIDYTSKFEKLAEAVSKIDTKPEIKVQPTQVKIPKTDYSPLLDALSKVESAVSDIQIPESPTLDLSPLISATEAVQQSISNLKFPVANYVLPFASGGKAVQVQLDSSGNVPVVNAGSNSAVSTNSSSATPLAANGGFIGISDDALAYSELRVTVFSNVASATDGLSIQQSSDNTNWDITDTYTVAANTGKTYVVPRQARYMRVVYTNGGTIQSVFRLQSILNRTGTAPSSNRAVDAYSNETDLVQNQTFNMLFNGATWDRARSLGGISVSSTVGLLAYAPVPNVSTPSYTIFSNNALVNTAVQVKGTAGKMYDLHVGAPNISMTYLQFFDVAAATSVTVGSTAPTFVFAIPAGGVLDRPMTFPTTFANGLKVAATTGATNGITPANACNIIIGYL